MRDHLSSFILPLACSLLIACGPRLEQGAYLQDGPDAGRKPINRGDGSVLGPPDLAPLCQVPAGPCQVGGWCGPGAFCSFPGRPCTCCSGRVILGPAGEVCVLE